MTFILSFVVGFVFAAAIGGWEHEINPPKLTGPRGGWKRKEVKPMQRLSTGDPRYRVNLEDDQEWKNLKKDWRS